MGLIFQSDKLELTNSAKQVKFSTTERMPHILYEASGTYTVPKILNNVNYVERVDEKIVLTNANINTIDPFILSFFTITGGFANSENKILVGGGSIILKILKLTTTNDFVGSSILDTKIVNGQIKLTVSQNLDKSGVLFPPDTVINDSIISGDDPVSISYKIYYGRFR